MPEPSPNQPSINWQELSESLGVETSAEIEYYFRGNVQLAGDPPIDDQMPARLSAAAVEIATAASSHHDQSPGNALDQETSQKTNMANNPSFEPEPENESRAQPESGNAGGPAGELELDWDTPVVPDVRSADVEADPLKPRSAKPGKRAAAARSGSKPASAAPPPAADPSSWDDLASSLGISRSAERPADPAGPQVDEMSASQRAVANPEPAGESSRPAPNRRGPSAPRKRTPVEIPDSTPSPATEIPFGAGLLENVNLPQPTRETTPPKEASDAGRRATPDRQRGPSKFADDDAEFDLEDDVEDESLMEEDGERLEMEGAEDSAFSEPFDDFDDDYVEFEIEDLDPAARRGERKPRASRPESVSANRPERDLPDEPVDLVDETTGNEPARPPRRRGSRGRGRKRPETGESRDRERVPDAPRSEPPGRMRQDVDDDDDADEAVLEPGDSSAGKKARNLPTWNETVDVIVQTNIASRKKQPRRRRSGGRGRRPE